MKFVGVVEDIYPVILDCLGQRIDQLTRATFPHVWLYDEEFGPQVNLSSLPHGKTQRGKRGQGKNQKIMTYLKKTAPVRKLNHQVANLTSKLTGKKKKLQKKASLPVSVPSVGSDEPLLSKNQRRKVKRARKLEETRTKLMLAKQLVQQLEQGVLQEGPNNNWCRSYIKETTIYQERRQKSYTAWIQNQNTRMNEKRKAIQQGRLNEYKQEIRSKKEEKKKLREEGKQQRKVAAKAKKKQVREAKKAKEAWKARQLRHKEALDLGSKILCNAVSTQ